MIEGTSLAVLDHKQEARARSIGHGHRLVYGIAGSGKSVILMSRAKLLAKDGKREFIIDAMVSSSDMAHRSNIDQMVNDLSTIKKELDLSHFDIFVHAGTVTRRSTIV